MSYRLHNYIITDGKLKKYVDADNGLTCEQKLEANHPLLSSNQSSKEICRYYIDPLDLGIPIWQLRMYSEQHLFRQEINSLFEEDDNKLPERLSSKQLSVFKTELIDSCSPIELYISERNANLIFKAPITRLNLLREAGLIIVAKYKGAYCYSWTHVQELFS